MQRAAGADEFDNAHPEFILEPRDTHIFPLLFAEFVLAFANSLATVDDSATVSGAARANTVYNYSFSAELPGTQ